MSLILEALRRSEAERRRAQAPDLLAPVQPAAAPAGAGVPRWAWLVLATATVLAALWLARAVWPTARTTEGPTTAMDAPPPSTRDPRPTPDRLAPPADAAPRPLVVAAPSKQAAATPAPVAATPPPAANTAPTASSAPPTADTASPATSAAPVPPPSGTDTLLRVSDLGSAERGQLPPLKLSMHMWNETPTQRFVIIDGTRLAIGDHLGDLAVADITSDGVVLDWNGRLLKLPLR